MVLSEKLAALRKEHGYSQLYVAECLNVSRQAISRWMLSSVTPFDSDDYILVEMN